MGGTSIGWLFQVDYSNCWVYQHPTSLPWNGTQGHFLPQHTASPPRNRIAVSPL